MIACSNVTFCMQPFCSQTFTCVFSVFTCVRTTIMMSMFTHHSGRIRYCCTTFQVLTVLKPSCTGCGLLGASAALCKLSSNTWSMLQDDRQVAPWRITFEDTASAVGAHPPDLHTAAATTMPSSSLPSAATHQMTQCPSQLAAPLISNQAAVELPDSSSQSLDCIDLSGSSDDGQDTPHAVKQELADQAQCKSARVNRTHKRLFIGGNDERCATYLPSATMQVSAQHDALHCLDRECSISSTALNPHFFLFP